MTEIRRRFTGAHTLQVESRPGPQEPWRPVSHLVAFGYEAPYTPGWELRHAIGYGARPGAPVLPFQPLSVRHFYGSPEGGLDATYAQIKRIAPPLTSAWEGFVSAVREKVPALPAARDGLVPVASRINNPLSVVPSSTPLRVPEIARGLDYEPRLGFVISRELSDATPEEAGRAISAVVLILELSLDEPADGRSSSAPVQPAPPSAIAASARSAMGFLGAWKHLTGVVVVNDEQVATLDARATELDLATLLAAASTGSRLFPGELFTIDPWPVSHELAPLVPGDHLVVEVAGFGRLEHTIA